jgi:hypothetical protein
MVTTETAIRACEPARSSPVGHDIGDRLAVDRERDALTGFDRIDDLRRSVAKVSNTVLHGATA